MLIFDQIIEISNINNTTIYNDFNYNESFFFDIETTGLSPKNSLIYLIGILYFDKEWHLKQWFLDNAGDEENMLKNFTSFITNHNFKNVIHFNGTTFDCKFINDHCDVYGIDFSFATINQFDLYKYFNKYKNVLLLDSLKQKSIEFAYGINRKDKLSGNELISKYKEYLLNKKSGNEEQLLLHNFEDISFLPVLTNILSLNDLQNQNYSITDYKTNEIEQKAELQISFKNTLPKFYKGNEYFEITPINKEISVNNNITDLNKDIEIKYKLTFGNIKTTSLKFFYKDYKNYFYLPNEDMAIHKSMAAFVDKDKKVKATKDNCYTKITDTFISIPEKPAFSKKYIAADNTFFDNIKIFKDDNNKSYIRLSELDNNDFLESFLDYIFK